MRLAKSLLVSFVVLSAACTDRAPTSPATSSSAAVSSSESAAAPGLERRHLPRSIASRGGTEPALQGVWGGEDIGLTITVSGASVEFDCAAGTIDAPLIADASGRFNLPGMTWFTPPVVFENWQPDKRPARYSGVIDGDRMTLTVTRLEDGIAAHFTLVRNAAPRLLRCV